MSDAKHVADAPEAIGPHLPVARVASLNADGSQKWFIPPYVVPAVIAAGVAISMITQS